MKYNDTFSILKTVVSALKDPATILDKINDLAEFINKLNPDNSMGNIKLNTNFNKGSRDEYAVNVPIEYNDFNIDDNNKVLNANSNNALYYKEQITPSNPQPVLNSITEELNSIKLQQAIILSEIVGKPRSKTRRRRKF